MCAVLERCRFVALALPILELLGVEDAVKLHVLKVHVVEVHIIQCGIFQAVVAGLGRLGLVVLSVVLAADGLWHSHLGPELLEQVFDVVCAVFPPLVVGRTRCCSLQRHAFGLSLQRRAEGGGRHGWHGRR